MTNTEWFLLCVACNAFATTAAYSAGYFKGKRLQRESTTWMLNMETGEYEKANAASQ